MHESDLLTAARNIIQSEIDTLNDVHAHLGQSFADALVVLDQITGRVVITGIGKNQFIGQKMAATFNSTGTPSVFMHAADAIHGDLGIIQSEDVVICLSRSGNSPEIKALLPMVKSRGHTLIGLVCEPGSYLDRQADISIQVPVKEEACPHHLTPSNSTTAFLVIGDALAISLIKMKGFTADDFGQLHPGGALGKRLYMKVADLFTLNAKPAVKPETSIHETIIEISTTRLGATAVLGPDETVEGIITDGDLRRLLLDRGELQGVCAADAMSIHPKTIAPDEFASAALSIMRANNITQLLVVKNDVYLGVIHIHDILREGIV